MLVIRNRQINLFREILSKQFEYTAANHLKERYGDALPYATEETLYQFIREGIVKAQRYNIKEQNDVLIFFDYLVLNGDDFDKDPAYRHLSDILRIRNLIGREKILRMLKKQPLPY